MIDLILALLYLIPFLSGAAISWVILRILQSREEERKEKCLFQAELRYATLPVDAGKMVPIFYKRVWDGGLGRFVQEEDDRRIRQRLERAGYSERGSVGERLDVSP